MTCVEKQELISLLSKVPKEYNNIITRHCEDTTFLVNILPDDSSLWTEFQRLWHLREKALFLWIQEPSVFSECPPSVSPTKKNKTIKILSNQKSQSTKTTNKDTRPSRPGTPPQDNTKRNRTKSAASPQKNIEPTSTDNTKRNRKSVSSPHNHIEPALGGLEANELRRRKDDKTDRLIRSKSASPPAMKQSIDAFKTEMKRKKESENTKIDSKAIVDTNVGNTLPEKMEKNQKMDSIMEMVLMEPKFKNKKLGKVNERMIRINSASPSSMKHTIDVFKTDLKNKKESEKKNLGTVNNHSEKEILPPRAAKNRSHNLSPVKEHSGELKRTGERRRKTSNVGVKRHSLGNGRTQMDSNKGDEGKGKVGRVGKREEKKENRENKQKEKGNEGEIRECKVTTESEDGTVVSEVQSVDMEIVLIDDDKKEKTEFTEESGKPDDTVKEIEITIDSEINMSELSDLNEETKIHLEEKKQEKKTQFIVEENPADHIQLEKEEKKPNPEPTVEEKKIPNKTTKPEPTMEEKIPNETTKPEPTVEEKKPDETTKPEPTVEEKKPDETTKPEPTVEEKIPNETTKPEQTVEEKIPKETTKPEQEVEEKLPNETTKPEITVEEKLPNETTKLEITVEEKIPNETTKTEQVVEKKIPNETIKPEPIARSPEKIIISKKMKKEVPNGIVDSRNIVVQTPPNELITQFEKSDIDLNEPLLVDNLHSHNDSNSESNCSKPDVESSSTSDDTTIDQINPDKLYRISSESKPRRHSIAIVSDKTESLFKGIYINHNRSSSDPQLGMIVPHQGYETMQTMESEGDAANSTSTPNPEDDSTQKSRRQKNAVDNKRNIYASFRTVSAPSYQFSGAPQTIPVSKKRPPKGAYESPEKLQLKKPLQPLVPIESQTNKTKLKKTSFGITVHLSKSVYRGVESPTPETRPESINLNLPRRTPPKRNGSIQSWASIAKKKSVSPPMSNTLKSTKEHLDNSISLLSEEEISYLIDHLVKTKVKIQPKL